MGNTRSYSKPSMSDAKERSYSKPSKFDAKEFDKPSEQQVISTKDLILQKAKLFSDDYPTYDDPIIWGVLTAITKRAIDGRSYQGYQTFDFIGDSLAPSLPNLRNGAYPYLRKSQRWKQKGQTQIFAMVMLALACFDLSPRPHIPSLLYSGSVLAYNEFLQTLSIPLLTHCRRFW
ncbi:hypothetical protein HS088_TW11G00265 [Tripterygium wilfordii]|uniref:Uncharacterized protein n=1 Tax=Tripterygium wilfordii TaxID=458696 RepID=A0A7J7D1T6_TRIWF|nr:hypothetical protein HS088_TW11G00265 [Tripterygium wilfordii]